MLNPFQFLDPWMMVGGAALLLLMFLAVFVWNSPRSRQPNPNSETPDQLRMVSLPAAPDGSVHPPDGRAHWFPARRRKGARVGAIAVNAQ